VVSGGHAAFGRHRGPQEVKKPWFADMGKDKSSEGDKARVGGIAFAEDLDHGRRASMELTLLLLSHIHVYIYMYMYVPTLSSAYTYNLTAP
jgi:hypothetical protein